ncbi:MAG: hypothetical protein Q7S43_02045 [bacterium]|nr:hypothetical protein [bacterium]
MSETHNQENPQPENIPEHIQIPEVHLEDEKIPEVLASPEDKKLKYTYGVARTEAQRRQAFLLSKRLYGEHGLGDPSKPSSFEPFILSPETKTFIAELNQQMFGTVSVVPDSEIGLPMDLLYEEELSIFRKAHKKIAETSQLAVDLSLLQKIDPRLTMIKTRSPSLKLYQLVLQYAIYKKIDELCIAVHPGDEEHPEEQKRAAFYKSVGFREIGPVKSYPSVNDAWAVAMALNIPELLGNKNPHGIVKSTVNAPLEPELFD